MQMLSEDDLNLRSMSDEELDAAWDLWFDLAQHTNASDPAYSHGVLVGWAPPPIGASPSVPVTIADQGGPELRGPGVRASHVR